MECPTPQLQALDGAMDTLYTSRRGEGLWPLGTRRYTQWDGGHLSHSGPQRGPVRPLVTVREGGREGAQSKATASYSFGDGEGEALTGGVGGLTT